MRSVLCLIAVSIGNACDEHHCWCWLEDCQKYIYIVGRKKSTLVYWRYIYYGCDVYFPVVCIYIQQPPFLNSNRAIQIHFTHAIHFVSVKSHFIQTNNQKKFVWNVIFYVFFRGLYFACGAKTKQQKSSLLTFRYARWKENESNYGASSFPCFASRFLCHIKGNAVQ